MSDVSISNVPVPGANTPFYFALVSYLLCVAVLLFVHDAPFNWMGVRMSNTVVPLILLLPILGLVCLVSLASEKPANPTAFLVGKFTSGWQAPGRLAVGVPILILNAILMAAFTSVKNAIPFIVPFYFDPYAAQIDRILHGGDAWRAIYMVAGNSWFPTLLDFAYGLWFPVVFGTLVIAAFSLKDSRVRAQYLVSYVICWAVLGNLMAILLSSVGPIYYHDFYTDQPFGDLIAYLQGVHQSRPLGAVTIQPLILECFKLGECPVGGISAAPSMHVAMAALTAIYISRINSWLGWAAWAFTGVILVGSVYLGWHYAIDGYISLLLVPLIWWGAGRALQGYHPTRL